jgi:hypothetical protein
MELLPWVLPMIYFLYSICVLLVKKLPLTESQVSSPVWFDLNTTLSPEAYHMTYYKRTGFSSLLASGLTDSLEDLALHADNATYPEFIYSFPSAVSASQSTF